MKTVITGTYLGGYPGHERKGSNAVLTDTKSGLKCKRGLSTIMEVPWSEVRSIEVDGPDQVAKRVTATRLLTIGVFAFAAKKKAKQAFVIVTTSAGELILECEDEPMKLRAKVAPLARQATLEPTAPPSLPPPAIPAGWLADPTGHAELRYWDGSSWTDHISTAGQASTDPV